MQLIALLGLLCRFPLSFQFLLFHSTFSFSFPKWNNLENWELTDEPPDWQPAASTTPSGSSSSPTLANIVSGRRYCFLAMRRQKHIVLLRSRCLSWRSGIGSMMFWDSESLICVDRELILKKMMEKRQRRRRKCR